MHENLIKVEETVEESDENEFEHKNLTPEPAVIFKSIFYILFIGFGRLGTNCD